MSRDRETLPPREFSKIRTDLGLSMDEFALALGYEGTQQGNRTTIQRFQSKKRHIPLPVAKLAWLLHQHGVPEWPAYLEAKPDGDQP